MMATSTKVSFKLEKLRERATELLRLRIAEAELEVASFDDDEALAVRVQAWYEETHERVRGLADALDSGAVDAYRLAKFKLDPIPAVDRYDRQSAERKLDQLRVKLAKVEAKSSALVSDEQGNVSLTKTQLDEFFGL